MGEEPGRGKRRTRTGGGGGCGHSARACVNAQGDRAAIHHQMWGRCGAGCTHPRSEGERPHPRSGGGGCLGQGRGGGACRGGAATGGPLRSQPHPCASYRWQFTRIIHRKAIQPHPSGSNPTPPSSHPRKDSGKAGRFREALQLLWRVSSLVPNERRCDQGGGHGLVVVSREIYPGDQRLLLKGLEIPTLPLVRVSTPLLECPTRW